MVGPSRSAGRVKPARLRALILVMRAMCAMDQGRGMSTSRRSLVAIRLEPIDSSSMRVTHTHGWTQLTDDPDSTRSGGCHGQTSTSLD